VRHPKRPLIVETLQHFLDDWKTRHDTIEIAGELFECDAWTPAEDFDPRAGINE
jgi:hypothetical protein